MNANHQLHNITGLDNASGYPGPLVWLIVFD